MTLKHCKLGQLVTIKTGKLDANAANENGVYPFFTCAKESLLINQYSFDADAILVAGNGDLNVKHYKGKFNAYQRTYVITVNDPKILCTRYLFHFMSKYVDKLREQSIGGVIKYIKLGMLTDAKIPLPAPEEQKRIAAILDKADAIRQKRQQAISLTDDFLRSIFLEMFIRAADNWTVKTIEYIADKGKGGLRTGPFGSHLLHSEFVDSGIPVLGIDNAVENSFKWGKARFITEEKYKSLSRYTVHPGDVLITIMGTCGRCAVVPDDIPTAINTKHLCCISLDYKKALPEFLHSYYLFHPMSRQYLAKVTKGAIMDGLNMGLIKTMPFPMVPIKLQEKYVEIKMNVLSSLDKQLLSESYQEDIFNSLSQQFFVGKCLTA
ncbi:restriction endonuclease subunit S [Aeromonas hydrophila]|uniref:restriction endonuclease subunit S n=1 Tax=Aeromonas hydrophila TaxID=644 RepID=UPI002B49BB3E|nr:restriction endonuclease subunit S [Aeromonas hydrophila]